MKNMLTFATVSVILLITLTGCPPDEDSGGPVQAPPENALDAFEQNRALGRGINLGNALEAPEEGDWGMTIREEYLQLIADAGFNSVRIPIRWNAHADQDRPYSIDIGFFDRVDQVISWAMAQELMVIINIHHYNALMDNPEEHKARFLSLWRQIAEHYYDYPYSIIFEVLNEPHNNLDPGLWNEYLTDAIDVIRESNPYRTLMIGTSPWGGIGGLQNLQIPDEDQNIIATVHYYEPFHFTHQGASWVGEESETWEDTTWTGTEEQKSEVDSDFDFVDQWATDHNRPIHVGEFGAYSEAPQEDRQIWTTYVRQTFEDHGFSWAYWEFGAGFGIYDRDAEQWREGLLEALIPDSPELSE